VPSHCTHSRILCKVCSGALGDEQHLLSSVLLLPASVRSIRTCYCLGAPCWSSCSSGTFAALPASFSHA